MTRRHGVELGPDPIDVKLGEEMRRIRKNLGMSQVKLADELGVTFQQVQKYERGANRVAASTLMRLCEAFGCTPNDLLQAKAEQPMFEKIRDRCGLALAYAEDGAYRDALRVLEDITVKTRGHVDHLEAMGL